MVRYFLNLFVIFILFGCTQKGGDMVVPEKVDGSVKSNDENIEVGNFFDFENLSEEVKNELSQAWWLGQCRVKSIDFIHDGVILGLHDDDYLKYMIVTSEKVIISYHLLVGTDGKTIIYDKKTGKLAETEITMFATGLVEQNVLKVERDYYDDLDASDPNYQGHIFETGTYDMSTDKYTKQQNDER